MIGKYGRFLLALDSAFNGALTEAPLDPSEPDDAIADIMRDMWPRFIDTELEAIAELSRALEIAGIEPKLARIKQWRDLCEEQAQQATDKDDQDDATEAPVPARSALRLAAELRALRQHVLDEICEMRFLRINDHNSALYDSQLPLFGEDVAARFAVANDDIAEAGKCLALARGTATVFHLMRVMEAGLRALGKELGIPFATSWESYKRQLDKLLDQNHYDKLTPEQKAKRPFYQDVLGDIVSIKSAWRNPTMHIVRTYDDRQAAVIFEAVKLLMQHLAKELSADPSHALISTGQSS